MQHRKIGITEQAGRLGRDAFWVLIGLLAVTALGVLTRREVHLHLDGLGTLSITSPPKPPEWSTEGRSPGRSLGLGAPSPALPHRSPRGAVVSACPARSTDGAGPKIIASPMGGIQTLEAKP